MAIGDVTVSVVNPIGYNGAYFDGVDDVITYVKSSSWSLGLTNGFTICTWVKALSYGGGSLGRLAHLNELTTNTNGFVYNIGATLKMTFEVNGGLSVQSATNSLTFKEWNFVAAKIDSSELITNYVNGVVSGTPTTRSGVLAGVNTANKLHIGNRADGTRAWKGIIRDVRIYNRDLTDAEVLSLYNGNNISDGLYFHAPLIEDYNDKIGGLTGTNSGSFLTSGEDILREDLEAKRVGASDKYFVIELNNGVMASHIAES